MQFLMLPVLRSSGDCGLDVLELPVVTEEPIPRHLVELVAAAVAAEVAGVPDALPA